jgi:hypothetical protein
VLDLTCCILHDEKQKRKRTVNIQPPSCVLSCSRRVSEAPAQISVAGAACNYSTQGDHHHVSFPPANSIGIFDGHSTVSCQGQDASNRRLLNTMARPEPAFARRWRHKFNAALNRQTGTSTTANEGSNAFSFPLAQYISLHLILSGFLLFSIGFLPRSQAWLDGILPLLKIAPSAETKSTTPQQIISADRPEHPFLTPLTANINVTLLWTIAGVVVSMVWWGTHLRRWWMASRTAERAAGSQADKDNTVKVSLSRKEMQHALHKGLISVLDLSGRTESFVGSCSRILHSLPSTRHSRRSHNVVSSSLIPAIHIFCTANMQSPSS